MPGIPTGANSGFGVMCRSLRRHLAYCRPSHGAIRAMDGIHTPDFPKKSYPMFDQERDVQGRIAQLWVYPVKSCAGIALQSSGVGATGLAWDRHWMVVDANGEFLTQRDHPRMAWIRPELEAGHLVLHFPQLPPLRIPLQATGPVRQARVWSDGVQAWDMGPEAARWLTQALGAARPRPCTLRTATRCWC